MFRGLRPPAWFVQRDIQILTRSFPNEHMVIFRRSQTASEVTDLGEPFYPEVTVFDGEALFIEAGGSVARFGLGEVEEDKPQILIPGWYDVRQGDRVRRYTLLPDGNEDEARLYTITYAPKPWRSFCHCTLENFGQGVQ
jgi:hypothetical protein